MACHCQQVAPQNDDHTQEPTQPRGDAGADAQNAKTGRPREAATPATAKEPAPGEKKTADEQPASAAKERRNKRACKGTDNAPPANQTTEAPAPAAASTDATAETPHAPAPDDANAAKMRRCENDEEQAAMT